jgi:Secretion system C-terminal sorting domain
MQMVIIILTQAWIGVSSTNSGILPGFEYKLEINGVQAPLTGKILSAANAVADEIDNDGVYNVTNIEYIINPGGSTAANSSFENNYNVDFGFTSNSLLPYTKLNLSAALSNNTVKLNWDTKDELNVVKYIIERSTDGIHFSATGTTQSKGNGSFGYTFNDNAEGITASKIYYRIRVEEAAGKIRYSAIVYVNIKQTSKLVIAPNPFTSYIHIQITAGKKGVADLRIINASGQIMYSSKVPLNEGQNSLSVNGLDNLSRGMYFLEIQSGNTINREKILKQ